MQINRASYREETTDMGYLKTCKLKTTTTARHNSHSALFKSSRGNKTWIANKGFISEVIKQKKHNWHYEEKQKGETKYITRSPLIEDVVNFRKDEIPLLSRFKCNYQGKFIEKIRAQ